MAGAFAAGGLDPDLLMHARDILFQHAFARTFVYNILWEDAEVDERYLGVNEDSSVLGISGAGCGFAGMLAKRPRSIDAIDINRHHLALTALKLTAMRRLESYAEFYDLFGRGWSPNPKQTVGRLVDELPRWIQRYWKHHHDRFRKTLYHQGVASRLFTVLRKLAGFDAGALRHIATLAPEERVAIVEDWLGGVIYKPYTKALIKSPAQLMALGVNYEQRDRMLESDGVGDLLQFAMNHFRRVAVTDIDTNWFAWQPLAGHFNHDNPEAVPPYLRKDRHEAALDAPTLTRFHHSNLFRVLESAGPATWSHYTLLDAPDWMPREMQKDLFERILRTARPGAKVLLRSVHRDDIVERAGMSDRLVRLVEISEKATVEDRSRQYKQVSFYEVRA